MSGAIQFCEPTLRIRRSVPVAATLALAVTMAGCGSGMSHVDFPAMAVSQNTQDNHRIVASALPPVPPEPIYKDGAPPGRVSTVAKERPAPPPQRVGTVRATPTRAERAPLAPVPQPSPPPGRKITVKRGDTLTALSKAHKVPIAKIMAANAISDSRLRAGQTLVIPGDESATPPRIRDRPKIYTVQRGDSMHAIARRHSVDHRALASHNSLTNPEHIRPGQVLRIPGTGSSSIAPVQVARAKPKPFKKAAPEKQVPVAKRGDGVPKPSSRPVPPSEPAPNKRVATKAPPVKKPVAISRKAETTMPTPTPGKLTGKAFRWPVRGRIISGYGSKPNGVHNEGINVAVPQGTSVKAAENGVVAYAGNQLKGYGNLILIRHADNWVSAYGHNETLLVKQGDKIRRGQIIAKAGKTGSVSKPQVHFELRKGSRPVDPIKHMADT